MPTWQTVSEFGEFRQDWKAGPWTERRVDPYLIWADITNFADVGGKPGKWIPITIELKGTTAVAFAKKMAKRPDNSGQKKWINMNALYSTPTTALASSKFCTALVTTAFFNKIADENAEPGKFIERFELALAMVTKEFVTTVSSNNRSKLSHKKPKRATCVVGIIDDGLAFAHERFRDKSGKTRIDFMWDQGYFAPDVVPNVSSPPYGREFTNADINQLINAPPKYNLINEDGVYRSAGYEAVSRRLAHGTFVLDLACGENPDDVTDDTPHIICVQIQAPSRRTRDRSAGWLTGRVIDGIRYILDRAEKVQEGCPVVVNLSFGNIAGPHDGSSMLEKAIDELIELRNMAKKPLKVVIAAGNSNLNRCHAKFSLPPNKPKSIFWRALPDDPTPNFLEIWLPEIPKEPRIELTVTSPTGCTSDKLSEGSICTWRESTADALCSVVYSKRVSTGNRKMILIALAPTFSHDPTRAVAPPGTWKIEFKNMDPKEDIEIHAWVQRDETPFDFPRHARQSRLDDPDYVRFDETWHMQDDDPQSSDKKSDKSYIKRRGTINSIATGEGVEVIGGYRRSDGTPARYSSSGPRLSLGTKIAPDGAGVSEDSITCHGILSSGSRSGAVVAMNGTSVAAPQITRWHAMGMAKAMGSAPARQISIAEQGNATPTTAAELAERHESERKRLPVHSPNPGPNTPPLGKGPTSTEHQPPFRERPRKERGGHGRIKFDRESAAINGGGRQFRK